MVEQTSHLSCWVSQHLSPEDKPWVDQQISFANCSIDRIVPPAKPEDNPLDVHVEGFCEWIVDERALKTSIAPEVRGMQLTADLNGYIERKLFTLNCGHAISAYLGHVKGCKNIDQAIEDPDIRRAAMDEAGAALHQETPLRSRGACEIRTESHDSVFEQDDVRRVGRQPSRKLGETDRLLGPTNMAREYGLPIDNLTRGIAVAFSRCKG